MLILAHSWRKMTKPSEFKVDMKWCWHMAWLQNRSHHVSRWSERLWLRWTACFFHSLLVQFSCEDELLYQPVSRAFLAALHKMYSFNTEKWTASLPSALIAPTGSFGVSCNVQKFSIYPVNNPRFSPSVTFRHNISPLTSFWAAHKRYYRAFIYKKDADVACRRLPRRFLVCLLLKQRE